MKILLYFLIFVVVFARSQAGVSYPWTGATSGTISVDGNGTSGNHALTHGDSLVFPAGHTWQEIDFTNLIGISGDSIVIINAKVGSSCPFCNGILSNIHYVKFVDYVSLNNLSTPIWARAIDATAGTGVDNVTFDHFSITNDAGAFSPQPAVIFEDEFNGSSPMYFTNNINQTYHHITFQRGVFSGFQDVDICRFGTDTTRSISLNVTFKNDTFKNVLNSGADAPIFLNMSNSFNVSIHDNYFHNFMYNCGGCVYTVHTGWIFLYGNGDVYNNKFDSSYANAIRAEGIQFNGLAGYLGPLNVYNNIDSRHWHYSFMEWSHDNIIGGNRLNKLDGFGSYNQLYCLNNTLYYTYRYNVNSVYAGMLVDRYTDSLTVKHNIVIAPEVDYTFDLATRGYIIYNGNGTSGPMDTADNHVVATWTDGALIDSSRWQPSKTSPFYHTSSGVSPTIAFDIYGVPRVPPASLGAVENRIVWLWGPVRWKAFKQIN